LFGMNTPALSETDFSNLGFSIKMEYVNQVQDTTFCGNTFSDQSVKLLINPENIGRLFWTCSPQYLNSKDSILESLFKSKSASLYVTGRFTPVAGHLAYKMLHRLSKSPIMTCTDYWKSRIYNLFNTIECTEPVINYHDRVLYSQKFGIPISDQLLLERFIMSCPDNNEMFIPYQFMNNCSYVSGYHH